MKERKETDRAFFMKTKKKHSPCEKEFDLQETTGKY